MDVHSFLKLGMFPHGTNSLLACDWGGGGGGGGQQASCLVVKQAVDFHRYWV